MGFQILNEQNKPILLEKLDQEAAYSINDYIQPFIDLDDPEFNKLTYLEKSMNCLMILI